MGALPQLTACGLGLIGAVLAVVGLSAGRPRGHHVGDAHRRNGAGSWEYVRPADTEPDQRQQPGRYPRGIRSNLRPGERP